MGSQNRLTGQKAYIEWNGTDISADYRSVQVSRSVDTEETTAGNDTSKSRVVTLADVTGSITHLALGGTVGDALAQLFYEGVSGTLIWGNQGSEAGKPKNGCVVIFTGVEEPFEHASVIEYTYNWERDGDWLFDWRTNGDVF